MMLQSPTGADDLTLAALAGLFDPRAIVPPDALDADARLAALALVAEEAELDGRWYWALTTDARRAGLARVPQDAAARDALLSRVPRLADDRLGAALRAALSRRPEASVRSWLTSGRTGTAGQPAKDDLDPNTLAQALELLRDAGVGLPDWAADPALPRVLRRAVILDHRARAQHRLLPGPLRGRRRELKALEDYLLTGQVAPSFSPPPANQMPSAGIGVFVVTGIGGTGKSALIEALRRRVERKNEVTFLTFDLDQASLRSGERASLTMELLRQLGLLVPRLDQRLTQVRADLRDMLSSATDESAQVEIASSAVYSALSQLGSHLAAEGLSNHRVALVFDTFEQALVIGQARVRLMADWLVLLRDLAGISNLRVILSGRESQAIEGFAGLGLHVDGRIVLGDLGTLAGRAKLRDMFRRLAIPHVDLVPDLIAAFGSNPLVIEIVAAFCRDRPRDEIAELAADTRDDLRGALDAEMRQRILYARILNRITDPQVKPLASPGLVLRRITPQLIREVLAEPCGLPLPVSHARSAELFAALSTQVWLVRPDATGEGLEHLPDLRRIMLPQIMALPEAQGVARAAAGWHAAKAQDRPGPDLWDALCYRALTDDAALDLVAAADLAAMAGYLGGAVLDLRPRAQALLREASKEVLTEQQIAALSGAAQRRAVRKRQARQVAEGLESVVLEEAASAGDTAGPSPAEEFVAQPDLARAAFAASNFNALSDAAPLLFQALLVNVQGTRPMGDQVFDLSHPAWLAALATLAPGVPETGRIALHRMAADWLQTEDAQSMTSLLVNDVAAKGAFRDPWVGLAVMIVALANQSDQPIGMLHQLLADEGLADPASAIVAQTASDWRREVLLMTRRSNVRPLQAQAAFGVPLLHPEVLPVLGSGGSGLAVADLPQPEWSMLAALADGRNNRLSDVTRTASALDKLTLRIVPADLPQPVQAALFPGRLPEFHAPLRLLLTEMPAGPALAKALAEVTAPLTWWPTDLSTDPLGQRPLGPTLAGTLVDLLDRAGQLPDLARRLAASDPSGRAPRLSALIDRFCTMSRPGPLSPS